VAALHAVQVKVGSLAMFLFYSISTVAQGAVFARPNLR
jgi:hypothetical protein